MQDNATTVRQAIEALGRSFQTSGIGSTLKMLGSGIGGGVSGLASFASNPIGAAASMVAATGMVTNALVRLPTELHIFTDTVINSYRHLSEVSSAMVSVFTRNDIQNTLRDIRRGNMLASSVEGLTQANQRLKDRTLGLEVTFERIQNKVLENLLNVTDQIVQKVAENPQLGDLAAKAKGFLEKPIWWLQEALNKIGIKIEGIQGAPEGPGGITMTDFILGVAKDGEAAQKRNDKRFDPFVARAFGG